VRNVDFRSSTLRRGHQTQERMQPGDVVVLRPAG